MVVYAYFIFRATLGGDTLSRRFGKQVAALSPKPGPGLAAMAAGSPDRSWLIRRCFLERVGFNQRQYALPVAEAELPKTRYSLPDLLIGLLLAAKLLDPG